MAIIKCKMCGGDLELIEGSTVAECEYCGTTQTVPTADSEKKLTLFARANRLRTACEFDKAAGVYEAIVADFPEEAEAYWGMILCKYGIEYVDDPASGKKIPTCHRSSFQSLMEDSDFEQVMENADVISRKVYREEAKFIEELRKNILAVSNGEKPYDVFICYKETDINGERTLDSVLAQDIYDALTEKGYRVFFSRITLEDKLGQEYEPYIFAALNSAKIMLAVGTDYEYYNAVWVKNEWSRYLKLMEQDKSRHLIPCYKGIDAYDMPKEFSRLQGQDLGKLGAIQDLLRGIAKLLPKDAAAPVVVQESVSVGGIAVSNLLKRTEMALEDEKWSAADDFCEQILNQDVENGYAYLYKFMAAAKITSRSVIAQNPGILFDPQPAFARDIARICQYAGGELSQWLKDLESRWKEEKERIRQEEAERLRREEEARRRQAEEAEAERRRKEEEAEAERQRQEMLFRQKKEKLEKFQKVQGMLAAGYDWAFSACVTADGSVLVADKPKNKAYAATEWQNIVAVAVESDHIVGLKADGTVVAIYTGSKILYFKQCDVDQWKNVTAISTGYYHTVGLKADGTVYVSCDTDNKNKDAETWKNIVAISAGDAHTVGLRADGTVVAVGENKHGECNVTDWKNIVAISAGQDITVGLRSDGTVVTTGSNAFGKNEVSGWRNIVAVNAKFYRTVGLQADGSVVVAGDDGHGISGVSQWRNMLAVSSGRYCVMGLQADGTVKVLGKIKHGKENMEEKNLFAKLFAQDRQQLSRDLMEARNNFLKS